MTQRALVAYSIGLLGLILIKVLAPAFYSRQDIKTPVKIAIVTLILTQLMNLVFIGPLQHAGLSLSIGLAACFNAGLLYWQLRKKQLYQPQPGWYLFLIKVIIAVILMSTVLWSGSQLLPDWSTGSMWVRIGRLFLLVIVGIVVYFASLIAMGFKIKHFIKRID
ncbi:virulence factor MviN [Gilliamella sp. WF3-4]|nr:virulence factor MviN [Gilliamella apicola]